MQSSAKHNSQRARAMAATLVVMIGTCGALLFASGAPASANSNASSATISVTGSGLASGIPDTLSVQIAVSTTARSATSSLDENNAATQRVEDVLLEAGVKRSGLQTSDLSLSPNYDSDGVITGYGTEDDLTVTFHDIATSGKVIDAAAHAAGNNVQIQGITFSISNTSGLLKRARMAAMHNARLEASEIAESAGTSLGPIVKITDNEQQTTPPMPIFGAAASGVSRSAVPVQAGTEQVSVQLDVVFALGS